MKKNRLIFYAIFAFFHLSSFIFTIILENNSQMLFSMVKYVPMFKYATLLGLIFVGTDIAWTWITNRDSQQEKSALAHELNMLKAKLFDLQEAAGGSNSSKPSSKS